MLLNLSCLQQELTGGFIPPWHSLKMPSSHSLSSETWHKSCRNCLSTHSLQCCTFVFFWFLGLNVSLVMWCYSLPHFVWVEVKLLKWFCPFYLNLIAYQHCTLAVRKPVFQVVFWGAVCVWSWCLFWALFLAFTHKFIKNSRWVVSGSAVEMWLTFLFALRSWIDIPVIQHNLNSSELNKQVL